ncbi:histidine phosphatase superfamily [Rhypophila decipiens]|uniref:Histidine phosphatase superfamily n=1 Tax=Rhypophila decipiens TaxID=261697 RepID=A0AAN6YB24_9PEZI|nr:histidine phosphatase superfamily [Rhypophila decipiens]
MKRAAFLLILPCLPLGAGETVLGAYIFHRHGSRTSKSYPPVQLTPLGASESRSSGAWYRNRYVSGNASAKIHGFSPDTVTLSQLSVLSPMDDILQNSAQAFLQGLYPPVGKAASSEQSSTEDVVNGLLDGYQYIPVNTVGMSTTGVQGEDNMRLQTGSGCPNAIKSTERYLESSEYLQNLKDTMNFYQRLLPVYDKTFPAEKASFEHAYGIYDLVHVSTALNDTKISHTELLTAEVQHQLYTLASAHEWGLAFNSSEPVRAMVGSILAGQIVQGLNATLRAPLKTNSTNRLTIQFGAYASFMSFFGLSQATAASEDFYGIVDYDSSFVIELVTDAEVDSLSSSADTINADDAYIRFLFANGTASETNQPKPFPLFGQQEIRLKWNTFIEEMSKFSITDTAEWCVACGATEGVCSGAGSSDVSTAKADSGGMSNVVAGVIGAVVTLAVATLLAALAVGIGGLRLVKKKAPRLSMAIAPKTSRDDMSYEERV